MTYPRFTASLMFVLACGLPVGAQTATPPTKPPPARTPRPQATTAQMPSAASLPATAGPPGQIAAPPKNRAPLAGDVLKVQLPRPAAFTLPGGGARVLVVEDHSLPLVTITVSVRAGALFDSATKPGVAALTASQLTVATQTRSFDQLAHETARIGATLSSGAEAERATVSISGLADDTDELIAILADTLLHPAFPTDRLEKAKFQQVSQRAQETVNPQYLASQLARQVLYGRGTAYGRPAPTTEALRAVSTDDLRAFYNARYGNAPTALIGVAGDVNPRAVFAKLSTALAPWTAFPLTESGALPPAEFSPQSKTRVFVIARPASAQTYLTFANLAIRRTDPDFFPLQVANYILGGSFNSRLNTNLREGKGFTYGVQSSFSAPKYPGTWAMASAVRNAVTTPAVAAFYDEFARIQSAPVTTGELAAAKRAIVGSFALTLESPSAVLERLLNVVDYGLPANYWDTYAARIQAVTADDVLRITRKYLGTGRIQLIAVGQPTELAGGLAAYGPVTSLTPAEVMGSVAPAPGATAPLP